MSASKLTTVAIIGLGHVGTSIALALRERGVTVLLDDHDGHAVDAAVDRGAGEPLAEGTPPADLSVLAVPPAAVPGTLFQAQTKDLAPVYTDVSSVKAAPAGRARQLGCDMTGFVPGHPLAEDGAPTRADLFRGRAWVLCQEADTRPEAVTRASELIELCGAVPVLMDAETHDQLVALISHAPYLVASAMAAALADAPAQALRLGCAGVRDVTRPADRDPVRWAEILNANARWVSSVLSEIAANLVDVCAALQLAGSGEQAYLGDVAELLRRGHAGRRRLTSDPDENRSGRKS